MIHPHFNDFFVAINLYKFNLNLNLYYNFSIFNWYY